VTPSIKGKSYQKELHKKEKYNLLAQLRHIGRGLRIFWTKMIKGKKHKNLLLAAVAGSRSIPAQKLYHALGASYRIVYLFKIRLSYRNPNNVTYIALKM